MRNSTKKIKSIFSKSLIVIFSIVTALLLSEIILRAIPVLRQKYAPQLFTMKFSPLQWLDNPGASYKFRSSDLLGHQRVPNCAPGVNSYGLIGKEFSVKKPNNTFRILVLGDSIAAQDYFVKFLKEKLNSLSTDKKFQIINAGVGSYQLWHYARFLKYKGIRFKPDMVLISLSLDDARLDKYTCYKTDEGMEIYSISAPHVWNENLFNLFLFRQSYVYRVFVVALEDILSGSEEYNVEKKAVANLNKIKKLSKKIDAPVFAFIWPALIYYKDYTEWEKKQYHLLIDSLEKAGMDYLDLSEVLPEERRRDLRERQSDYVHPSAEAHYMAAESIYNHIAEKYRSYLE